MNIYIYTYMYCSKISRYATKSTSDAKAHWEILFCVFLRISSTQEWLTVLSVPSASDCAATCGLHVRTSSWLTGQRAHVTLLFLAKSSPVTAAFSNSGKAWICDTSASRKGRGSLSGGVQRYLRVEARVRRPSGERGSGKNWNNDMREREWFVSVRASPTFPLLSPHLPTTAAAVVHHFTFFWWQHRT